MLIRLEVLTDGDAELSKTIECTEDEWQKLIAPAVKRNCPIDGATVDPDLLDELMDRPTKRGRAKHTLPIV